ncbi:MAG: hypothetical protein PHI34_09345 [Acidobacteriota bacterium]|nr:hypothetical protein [Acidobacteriota bacterium]
MKRSPVPVVVLILALAGSAGLKKANDSLGRTKIPGSGIIYIPSGAYLKPVTFGFPSLAADLIYLWSIQYFGNPAIPDKFKYFTHIFSIISELDPRYVDPYEVGALIALYDARDVPLAVRILDLGLAKNPDRWIFPLEAGHYAKLYAKDVELARAYYKKAMDIPGAPAITKRLYANAAFKALDYRTAWETWREVYDTSADAAVRKIASNHLYNIQSVVDGEAVRNAVFDFRARFGRNPADLEELVRSGRLREVPRDFDGRDYLYDPRTGGITTRVNPWKR